MLPAVILATDARGIAAGLNVADIVKRCRANPMNTLIAGLMLIAASFVSSLGVIACGIGAVFTAAYALAMQAWIIRSFAIVSTPPKAGQPYLGVATAPPPPPPLAAPAASTAL